MARHWDLEVWTTCALDYMTWADHYPPGVEQVGRVSIRRFSVDQLRDVTSFNALSGKLQSDASRVTLKKQEEWMRAQGPMSTGLLHHLEESRDRFDAFVFFGYLYATTYFGLPLVAEKAILAPLAHDEWTIHLPMWDRFFEIPKGFIFQTEEEKAFASSRFGEAKLDGPVAGIGIVVPEDVSPARFRAKYSLDAPFLLYVGRVDASKGCGEMFEWFMTMKAESSLQHKLIVIGTEVMPVPFHDDIIYLGFVTPEEKQDAMAASDWLLMPSPYESLSIVLLETWAVGRPALVNGRSAVLRGHCERAHGGLWYETYKEWATAIQLVTGPEKDVLGAQGMAYTRSNYTWERVEQDYLSAIASVRGAK